MSTPPPHTHTPAAVPRPSDHSCSFITDTLHWFTVELDLIFTSQLASSTTSVTYRQIPTSRRAENCFQRERNCFQNSNCGVTPRFETSAHSENELGLNPRPGPLCMELHSVLLRGFSSTHTVRFSFSVLTVTTGPLCSSPFRNQCMLG